MLGVLETVDLEDVLKSVLNSHGRLSVTPPGITLMLVSYVSSLDSLAMVWYINTLLMSQLPACTCASTIQGQFPLLDFILKDNCHLE